MFAYSRQRAVCGESRVMPLTYNIITGTIRLGGFSEFAENFSLSYLTVRSALHSVFSWPQ